MRTFNKLLLKGISSIALIMGMATGSQACVWWFHQPRFPEEMKKNTIHA